MCSQCGPGPCLSLLSVGDTITMQCNNGTRVNGTCLKIAFFWQTFSPVWAIMPVSCRHHWNGTFPHFAGCLHATTRHQAAGAPVCCRYRPSWSRPAWASPPHRGSATRSHHAQEDEGNWALLHRTLTGRHHDLMEKLLSLLLTSYTSSFRLLLLQIVIGVVWTKFALLSVVLCVFCYFCYNVGGCNKIYNEIKLLIETSTTSSGSSLPLQSI